MKLLWTVAMALLVMYPVKDCRAYIDSLIISTIDIGPEVDTAFVPVYMVYEEDICTADINLSWYSDDRQIYMVGLVPAAESYWTFPNCYIDSAGHQTSIHGENSNFENAGRELAFFLKFAVNDPQPQEVFMGGGDYYTSVYWDCAHFTGTFVYPIGSAIRYHSTRPQGDANGSYSVNGLDVVYMVSYLKGMGPAPDPILIADVNGDCLINGLDVVYLVSYLKGQGPAPIIGECN